MFTPEVFTSLRSIIFILLKYPTEVLNKVSFIHYFHTQSRSSVCYDKSKNTTMASTDKSSKEMALVILKKLQEMGFAKSSKALEKEILKRFSLKSLPSTLPEKILVLQEKTKGDADIKDYSSSGSSSDSGSDSDSDGDDDGKKATATKTAKVPTKEVKIDSSDSSSDSDDEAEKKSTNKNSDKKSSGSDNDSDSDSEDDEPPKKKAKAPTPSKPKANADIVTPEESSDSDSDVSDVDVSSVSSVSSDEESDSDSSSSDSSSDSESEDEDLEARQAAKRKKAAELAKEASKAALAWTPKKMKNSKDDIKTEAGTDGAQALSYGKPFQRVDDSFWGEKAMKDGGAMADNSYGNVFGEGGFGARSSEKLLQVRGKRFQHEKTKRKRSFNGMSRNGGKINMESNSTKYKYDS